MKPNITNIPQEEWKNLEGKILHIKIGKIQNLDALQFDISFRILELNADCKVAGVMYAPKAEGE